MSTQRISSIVMRSVAISMLMFFVGATAAQAADEPPAATAAPSKETRDKLAAMHEKMAACLRSDKAISECRSQMMQSCQTIMGTGNCPMYGQGMHGPMMNPPPPSSPDDK